MTYDAVRFSGQVHSVLCNQFPQGKFITLGNTPIILQELGLAPLPLVMHPAKLREIVRGRKHSITEDVMLQVPERLSQPVMVFKSVAQENAIVVLLDLLDSNAKPVIAAMHLSLRQRAGHINLIASVYGKDNAVRWIVEQISKNRVLYVDKKKALWLSDSIRLQLPEDVLSQARADDTRHFQILSHVLNKVKENKTIQTLMLSKKKGADHENQ